MQTVKFFFFELKDLMAPVKRRRLIIQYSDSDCEIFQEENVVKIENQDDKRIQKINSHSHEIKKNYENKTKCSDSGKAEKRKREAVDGAKDCKRARNEGLDRNFATSSSGNSGISHEKFKRYSPKFDCPKTELSTRKRLHKRSREDSEERDSNFDNYVPYEGIRTVLSWLIDSGVIPEFSKVKYVDLKTHKARLGGKITRYGILCNCCGKTLKMSEFEVHAGSKESKPYESIFVEKLRVSLTKCLLHALKKQGEKGSKEVAPSGYLRTDDTCGVCGDGGDLMLCDSCPSAFHMTCLGIQELPAGDWHCMHCLCKFCNKTQAKIKKHAFLSCLQCGQKYHKGCVPEKDPACASSSHNSFCGPSCRKICVQLQRLLGVRHALKGGYSWTLVRKLNEHSTRYQQRPSHVANCNSKIAVAFNVMNECFTPILDRQLGINLVKNVIYNYGSNCSRIDFSGFYTFVLEYGDEIVSVASVRIHGAKLAEMPFIGTRDIYRRQGMCRRLLTGIESALDSMNVKKLVIPATSELKSTWINNFGFNILDSFQKRQFRSVNILTFPDASLLQKPLASDRKIGSAKKVANLERNGKLNDQIRKIENELFGPS